MSDNATSSSDEESESTSSNSDGGRKPRYGEISAESSGKSTSAKVVPEENPLRHSRTNELTVATAKPASNDSKQDGRKNATLHESAGREKTLDVTGLSREQPVDERSIADVTRNPESKDATSSKLPEESSVDREDKRNVTANTEEEIMTVKSIGDSSPATPRPTSSENVVKPDEKRDKIVKTDYKEVVSKVESKKDKSTSLADSKDREDVDDRKLDRKLGNDRDSKKDAAVFGTTASEAHDLAKIDERGHEGTISLINDTNVNYATSTAGKERGVGAGKRPNDRANGTREKGDPKEEVEVVRNVTYQPTLKIVAVANDSAENESRLVDELNRSQKGAVHIARQDEEDEDRSESTAISSAADAIVASTGGAEERKSIGEPESQVKLPETTTRNARPEEQQQISSTPEVIPSPIPQGRTIGFSGVNEFPSAEVKPTASTTRVDDGGLGGVIPSSRKNSTSSEKIDAKPYPYLKSSGAPFRTTTTVTSSKPKNGDVTERTHENAIGREESEKKFVVTEPSVVVENSIQQRKSSRAKSANGNSTTENPDLASVIPITSSRDIGPTNETLSAGSDDGAKASANHAKGSNENDVPNAKEEESAAVVAGRDEGYDVTGNAITEVSSAANGASERSDDPDDPKSRSDAAPPTRTPSTSRPAETSGASSPKASSPDADIQTEPEEAMMIRSTFTVTESTMVPTDRDVATEANKSATSTAAEIGATVVRENSTESPLPGGANVATQSSLYTNRTGESPHTALNPNESSIPTTTPVEFEFVGLTEVAGSSPLASNATERNVLDRRTTPRSGTTAIRDSSANSTQGTIVASRLPEEESTVLPSTTTENAGTAATDRATITTKDDAEATEVGDPPVTRPTHAEEQSNRTEFTRHDEEVTASVIEFTSAITGVTENPAESSEYPRTSDDANVTSGTSVPDATEPPIPNSRVTIPYATNATAKGPSITFPGTSIPEPRVPWSTPGFTESPEEETTDGAPQTLSPDEITLLVKIVIEGTLHEVCPRLQDLRSALADILTKGMDR